jgi:HicB family
VDKVEKLMELIAEAARYRLPSKELLSDYPKRIAAILAEPTPGVPGEPTAEKSGRFVVRVPKSLHAALEKEAEREGISLNMLCVMKLQMPLIVDWGYERLDMVMGKAETITKEEFDGNPDPTIAAAKGMVKGEPIRWVAIDMNDFSSDPERFYLRRVQGDFFRVFDNHKEIFTGDPFALVRAKKLCQDIVDGEGSV